MPARESPEGDAADAKLCEEFLLWALFRQDEARDEPEAAQQDESDCDCGLVSGK